MRACRTPDTVAFPIRPLVGGLLLMLVAVGCGGEGAQERVPLNGPPAGQADPTALPAAIQEGLDAGNTAYRAGDYEQALDHFREVTHAAPDLAVGWYGVGLAQAAMGNPDAADSAMMEVHRLAPDLPLQHPGTAAPQNPHMSPPPASDGDDGGYPGQGYDG